MKIVNAYVSWAKNEVKPKIVIVYETMWGSTEKMAKKIAEGVADSGVSVKLFDVNQTDRTTVIKEMLDAKGYIIGSSTHDNDLLINIAGFLEFLKGLRPKNRIGCSFGSYGWAGGATGSIEGYLKKAGVEIAQQAIVARFAPDKDELKKCYEYGKSFADIVKKKG